MQCNNIEKRVIEQFKNAARDRNPEMTADLFGQILQSAEPHIAETIETKYSAYMNTYGEDLHQACASRLLTDLCMFDMEKDEFGTFVRTLSSQACRDLINQINAYATRLACRG